MWLRLAGRSGLRGCRDGGQPHIRGLGTPRPWFRRTSAVYSRARPLGWRLLMGTPRTGCARCRGGSGRLASRNGMSIGVQREALILRVVGGVCFCGTEAACVRGSPVGMDAGGTRSG